MTLDLSNTAAQLYSAASHFTEQREAKLKALATAVTHLQMAAPQGIEERRLTGHSTWLVAGMASFLNSTVSPLTLNMRKEAPFLPHDYVVAAVDGSHIDVDRHSPVRCFLINTGYVSLRYGDHPTAELYSSPSLFVDDDDLAIRNPALNREQPIEGPILGLLRAVMEIEALADLAETVRSDLPMLGLLDGSLILWGLAGGAFPDYVRHSLIDDRLLPALDRLKRLGESRAFAVVSHISLPGSHEIVNALRISKPVCGWDSLNCDGNCGALKRGERHCDVVAGVSDAELFDAVLAPGERSAVFDTTSSVVADHYRSHQIRFCYVHLGEEVCRLEMPAWSAEGPALDLAHAALLAQAAKGNGYPIALQEAHEQAVVSGADRDYFTQLVEEMLVSEGLPTTISQKSRSKRTRFI